MRNPRAYEAKYKCGDCRHVFTRRINDPNEVAPDCPKCKKNFLDGKKKKRLAIKDIGSRIERGVGNPNKTKAIDLTNEIVSENHHTNFALDEQRKDESMAPKLTPRQQELKGAMFGGKSSGTMPVLDVMEGKVKHVPRKAIDSRTKRIVNQINSGSLKDSNDVVSKMHNNKTAMKVNVVASDGPQQ